MFSSKIKNDVEIFYATVTQHIDVDSWAPSRLEFWWDRRETIHSIQNNPNQNHLYGISPKGGCVVHPSSLTWCRPRSVECVQIQLFEIRSIRDIGCFFLFIKSLLYHIMKSLLCFLYRRPSAISHSSQRFIFWRFC